MRLRRLALASAAALSFASAANAASIVLWDTGVNANGTRLADNQTDTHWKVNGNAPITFSNGAYAQPGDASWIGVSAGGGFTSSINYYTLTFDLTGLDASTAVITGKFAADDYGIGYLNGNTAATTAQGAYGSLTSFTFNSGFVSGLNTLTFKVTDTGGQPSGLIVSALSGSASAVPEPATWAMMIGGFGMVGGALRRSRRVSIRFA